MISNLQGLTTTWNYHAPTGLLTSKVDANAKTVSYTYTAAGQPYQRTWARGVVTTYAYSGTTGEQIGITYSDSTPSVSFTYNRLGKTATVVDVTGTRTFTYNLSATLELQSETLGTSGSAFFGDRKVNRAYDTTGTGTKGRYTGVTVTNAGVIDGYNIGFSYQTDARLATIYNHTYTYLANSHLVEKVTSAGWNYEWQRAYHSARDVVATSTSKGAGGSVKSAFGYTRDSLYRAITVAKTGEVFNAYGNGTQGLETDYAYNDRSELTADSTTLGGSTTPLSGRDDYHAYDPIGNRTQVLRSGAAVNYTANNLNQYTAFTGSSTHTYDDDGNLTNDGVWTYAWDAENRLITQDSIAHVRKLEFKYDYLGRRVQKTVREGWNGSAYTTVPTERKFLYDGHELIQEFTGSLGHVSNYVWGLGLDASRSGAGGVGGLLFIYDYATGHVLQPAYDAMGNVSGLVRSDGALVAKYEYDAFGQTIATSGTYAAANPFRFATNYTDTETGLINNKTRYYLPSLGRFLNRDTIGERGGLHLYAYVTNNPTNYYDPLGRMKRWHDGGGWTGGAGQSLLGGAGEGSHIQTVQGYSQDFTAYNNAVQSAGNAARQAGASPAQASQMVAALQTTAAMLDSQVRAGIVGATFASLGAVSPSVTSTASTTSSTSGVAPENSTSGSAIGDALRGIPLVGGLLGGVGDIVSGVVGTAAGILTLGQSGTFSSGVGNVAYGLGETIGGSFDLAGKAWNAPNTAIGLTVGLVGYGAGIIMGTDPGISFGHNAIQFTNNPAMFLGGAITLGNAIIYAGSAFRDEYGVPAGLTPATSGLHEQQHTYQGQLLGPAYLPTAGLSLLLGTLLDGDPHGPHSFMEKGPQMTPPQPWP